MLDEIRLADLRTFQLVVRHGGFSSAARASDSPQTTLVNGGQEARLFGGEVPFSVSGGEVTFLPG
jgi:hypothetical protein